MRKAYDRGALAESDLAPAPLPQFARWLREAAEAGMAEPNAMSWPRRTPPAGHRRGWSC
jgi:pyridoxamine 5'-phosphate oxidase